MIYLNSAATTKPYKQVIETIADVMNNNWHNASSSDSSRAIIESAREAFAVDLNCDPSEIIFTSGACEADSLAIMGFLQFPYNIYYDFYYSSLEHASINELARHLPPYVGRVKIPNDNNGNIGKKDMSLAIMEQQKKSSRKPLVSISAASSEVGTIQDIKAIAEVAHGHGGVIHCDATQLFPERPIDVKDWDVDMLSISGQKFHAGTGCGLLYVRNGIQLEPLIFGSQERGIRGGTYNTSAIAGMYKALQLTRDADHSRINLMRNWLLGELLAIPGVRLNGAQPGATRLINNISVTIDGVNAETLVTMCGLMGVVIAKGSACQSYVPTPSPALLALGLTEEQALNTIRITLDEFNTMDEIKEAAHIIKTLIEQIRE